MEPATSSTLSGPEEGLRQQLAELDHLYRKAPVGLGLVDRELRYVRINERLAEINGKPVVEHIGRTVREVLPEMAPTLEPILRQVLATGEAVLSIEMKGHTHADPGGERSWLVSYYPLLTSAGSVEGVSALVQEVTEYKRVEEALRRAGEELEQRVEARTLKLARTNARLTREIAQRKRAQEALETSEQRLRLLLETSNVIPWEADARTWRFSYVGPQALKLLGYPVARWYEESFWVDHIHPEDREYAIRTCRECSKRYRDYEFAYRMLAADGQIVWLHDVVSVEAVAGEPVVLRGFMIDITDRKRAEEALSASEEKYRDLYDNAPDMFCSVHSDGRVLQCNETLVRKTGYTKEEILELWVYDLYHADCLPAVERSRSLFEDTGTVRDAELQLRSKEGGKIDVSLNVSVVRDEAGKVLYGRFVWRDVTRRKAAEAALRKSEEALRKSQRELRALAGKLLSAQEEERRRLARELHDDLTQRLAVLAIEAGRLEQEFGSSHGALHERLRAVKGKVVELCGDVHRMSHQLHPSILDDLGLVDAINAECNRVSEQEGLVATFVPRNVPKAIPREVSLCLYRIAQESLRNIAKHARAPEACITLTEANGTLLLTVEDFGIGFDPTQGREKAGLGLASMEERVRLIQGRLAVRSRPGHGTVIEVRAPLMEVVE